MDSYTGLTGNIFIYKQSLHKNFDQCLGVY